MCGTQVVIQFAHQLTLVAFDRIAKLRQAALILGGRQAFAEVDGRLAQKSGIDPVVHERSS